MSYPRCRPAGAVPVLALLALACLCFARLFAHPAALIVDGERPSIDHANPGEPRGIGNDVTFFFLPHHLSIARAIRTFGHLPQWDDRGFGGRPLAGNPQGGMFYPPVWLVWWSGSPSALGWLTALHLLWGGIGTYVLMRSFQLGRWGATVAAAIYQASPFLLAHTFEGHYPHVWAACWYPWAFWAYGQHRSNQGRGRLLLPVILALTYLTGHPQEWFFLILALTAWSLFDAWNTWRSWPGPHGRRAGRLDRRTWLIARTRGGRYHPRAGRTPLAGQQPSAPVGFGIPRRYHLWHLSVWQLLSPRALGGPSDYFGDDNYWEALFSIGLVPLVLAVVGALRYPDRRLARGWLVLAGLAIWFACGRHLILYTLAFLAVPGMSWFRVPARALFLANLAGAVLAGLGVETLEKHFISYHDWRKLAIRFGWLFAPLLGSMLLILLVRGHDSPSRAAEAVKCVLRDSCFWLSLGTMTAIILIASLPTARRLRRHAAGGLGLLALCELGWYGFSLIQVAPPERFLGNDSIGTALIRLDHEANGSGRIRIKARDSFYGDLPAAVLGIEKTNITDVYQLDHAARLYQLLYPVASFERRRLENPMQEVVDDYRRQVRQAVFDRLSVGYLVSNRFESNPGWPRVAQGVSGNSPWVIQRNLSALPRAYVVPTATISTEKPSLALARFRETDPRQTVFMSSNPLYGVPTNFRQSFIAADWASVDPDHPVLTVTTGAPGLLVITDTWMPGWTAHVDGVLTPIFEGNLAQRVIPITRAGGHIISLNYRAPGSAKDVR